MKNNAKAKTVRLEQENPAIHCRELVHELVDVLAVLAEKVSNG